MKKIIPAMVYIRSSRIFNFTGELRRRRATETPLHVLSSLYQSEKEIIIREKVGAYSGKLKAYSIEDMEQ